MFERCRKFGISLNPKKTIFFVSEGILSGCVVSKNGIMIDPERTQAISKITYPSRKKAMQSFLGKINFVRRFIPSFSEIIRPLQKMIKKDDVFNWGQTEKESFQKILEAISEAPSLLSPYFNKDFILYTFASDISYATVLTQLNQQNNEVPISFMSSNFKGDELNYHEVDKQAFAVFKAVKHFHPYLLKSKTKIIVPYSSVRNLLVQKDLGEKIALDGNPSRV